MILRRVGRLGRVEGRRGEMRRLTGRIKALVGQGSTYHNRDLLIYGGKSGGRTRRRHEPFLRLLQGQAIALRLRTQLLHDVRDEGPQGLDREATLIRSGLTAGKVTGQRHGQAHGGQAK